LLVPSFPRSQEQSKLCPSMPCRRGSVASHPPQEQKIIGSNPGGVRCLWLHSPQRYFIPLCNIICIVFYYVFELNKFKNIFWKLFPNKKIRLQSIRQSQVLNLPIPTQAGFFYLQNIFFLHTKTA
jgi:hypothetical protein